MQTQEGVWENLKVYVNQSHDSKVFASGYMQEQTNITYFLLLIASSEHSFPDVCFFM